MAALMKSMDIEPGERTETRTVDKEGKQSMDA
jgi:hypothetical protein